MKIPKFPRGFKHVELVDMSSPFDLGDIGHAIMDDGRVQIIGKDRAMAMLEGNNRSGRWPTGNGLVPQGSASVKEAWRPHHRQHTSGQDWPTAGPV